MTRWLVGLLALGGGGVAQAQVYGAPGAGGLATPNPALNAAYAPNFYNRAQQPLSPYLNLARGGDPAVNYFYGVRPGLNPSASGLSGFGFPGGPLGGPGAGNRFYLQPPADLDELPSQPLGANRELRYLPSAAHPVTFGTGTGLRTPARTGLSAQQPASRPATAPRR